MIFESHAHYDDEAFQEDRDDLLQSLPSKGIEYVINVGASLSSTQNSLELAEKYPFVYAAVGVHPSETAELNEDSFRRIREACFHEKTVAVGEIGLDYYWDTPERQMQKEWFVRQLHLANEVNLPIIVHSRDAAADTLEIMKAQPEIKKGGVIHCFSYSKEVARDFLNMGYHFGIGGVITFSNGKKLKEVVQYLPMDSILLETDCPYLAPVPYRGKRNQSSYLSYVAEEIATIKQIGVEEVIRITADNAKKLFLDSKRE